MHPFTSLGTRGNIECVEKPHVSSLFVPLHLIRCEPEETTGLENDDQSNRGAGNIDSAIDQGSISTGHKPLMELVGKRVQADNPDTPHRLTQPPPKRLLLREATINKRGQDSILRDVGRFSQENVQNMERSR